MFNDKYGLTQAVLEGRKTQTRRIIECDNIIARHWNPIFNAQHLYYTDERGKCQLIDSNTGKIILPRYKVGEVVAIAQSYKDCTEECIKTTGLEVTTKPHLVKAPGYKNKMFVRADLMPHHIRITDVRVERLNDISESDIKAEGIDYVNGYSESYFFGFGIKTDKEWIRLGNSSLEAYAALIDKVSGKGTWERNPYVFVYEFELID